MSFAADVSKWCRETVPEQHKKVVRRVVAEIANRAIYMSPVGNPELWLFNNNGVYVDFLTYRDPPDGYVGGGFRGNWQYGFGSAPVGDLDEIDAVGKRTENRIKSAISNQHGVHWIANNLPYAQRIENGWSTQAPQGIVGLIELEFPQIFNAARAQA
jgi:hypothetical protein